MQTFDEKVLKEVTLKTTGRSIMNCEFANATNSNRGLVTSARYLIFEFSIAQFGLLHVGWVPLKPSLFYTNLVILKDKTN